MSAVCQSCGAPLSDTAKFCSKCGTAVPAVSSVEKICPTCGKHNRSGALYCRFCGTAFSGAPVRRAQLRPVSLIKLLLSAACLGMAWLLITKAPEKIRHAREGANPFVIIESSEEQQEEIRSALQKIWEETE